MSSKHASDHWSSKQPAKHDEVREAAVSALDWVLARRQQALWVAGGVAALAVVAAFVTVQRQAQATDAWDRYAVAELLAYGGRPQDSLDNARKLADDHPRSPAAAYARLLEGDLLFPKGDYKAAADAFGKAAEAAEPPVRPIALANRLQALEAAGLCAEAVAAAQSFLDAHADHFLAPLALSVSARCQATLGQADAAKATLQRLALQYADSPWAAWANARLAPAAK